MSNLLKLLSYADRGVAWTTRLGVILGMSTLFVLLLIRIIARVLEIPFVAYDEVGELATVWMILFGIVAMWREGTLYRVEFLHAAKRLAPWADLFVQFVMLGFAAVLVWVGGNFTAMSREMTAFMQIDMTYYYGAIPVAGAVMVIYSLQAIILRVQAIWLGQDFLSMRGDASMEEPVSHL